MHHRCLHDVIIARDPRPSLYPFVIALAGGGERLGVLGLVRYEDPAVIRPHEATLDKPLADRAALLAAMRVDLEPVLLLSEDRGRLDALLREDLEALQPLVRHRDADGHVHVLYKLDDPERIARYRAVLDVPSAIADGHHRYKVGQRFAQEHQAAPDTAAAAKLAVITSLDSPALTIDPIHRAFKEPVDVSRLAGVPAAVRPFPGKSGLAFAAAVAAAPQPALGFWVRGREPEVWQAGQPGLAVEVFQDTVLPALCLPGGAATGGTAISHFHLDHVGVEAASVGMRACLASRSLA